MCWPISNKNLQHKQLSKTRFEVIEKQISMAKLTKLNSNVRISLKENSVAVELLYRISDQICEMQLKAPNDMKVYM